MGTPDFAVPSLERLFADGHEVVGVFTKADKPVGRGMKLAQSAVKVALNGRSPLFQPETFKDGEALKLLRELAPEVIVVVAYGKLLPREVLELPPYGCVNIHGSLLPHYRGAAPIQRAVLNGETVTGVTSMYMSEELDAGDTIFTAITAIDENETAGELFDRLAPLGAELLSETLAAIEADIAVGMPQDVEQATYAPPLTRDMAVIDWTKPAREVHNLVRGLNPWPIARATFGGTEFKVFATAVVEASGAAGTILEAGDGGLTVACGEGAVIIKELQVPGGRRMAAGDYLRGHAVL